MRVAAHGSPARIRRALACVLSAVAAIAAAGVAPPAASAHKFHASLAEIDYNAGEKTAEIAIRIFTDDLEEALARRAGKRVRVDVTPDVDDLALDYVREALVLSGPDGKPLKLTWVGKETAIGSMWVYVQADAPKGLDGARLRDALFFELFDDQVNVVNVSQAKRRTSLSFVTGAGEQTVSFAD